MTSYAAWAKFDVDAELALVDERLQREEQQRAKQRVEDAASAGAAQDAQVLAAHAAVAALKAKAIARRQQQQQQQQQQQHQQVGASSAALEADEASQKQQQQPEQEDTSAAERLQRHAELFRAKHALMAQIMERRRDGDRVLKKECDSRRALLAFEDALTSALELEKIAPELLRAEKEQHLLRGAREKEEEASEKNDSAADGHDHRHDHEGHDHAGAGEGAGKCAHDRHAAEDPSTGKAKALPRANDLPAILKMFFKDVYAGIGACHLQDRRLAAASEAFKEVLLRDELHVPAWMERGRAFEQMGAGLLAMLHYGRAATLDPLDASAKEAVERVNELLLSDLDDVIGPEAIERRVEALAQSSSGSASPLLVLLESIRSLFHEANVLMVEGFFQYAIPKYQIVLGCVEFADRQRSSSHAVDSVDELATAIQDALCQIRTSCCLNIAGGYHEMQKNQSRAVEYCEQILAADRDSGNNSKSNVRAVCHFRIGQLLWSAHSYERAMEHLAQAREVAGSKSIDSEEQRRQMLERIDKEIDRCSYERGQHDLAFLRSLTQDARATEMASAPTSK